MSLQMIKTVFESAKNCTAWSIGLLKVKNTKKMKKATTNYVVRSITLKPDGELTNFLHTLCDSYLDSKKGIDYKFSNVVDYNGTAETMKIYKLNADNPLLADAYRQLILACAEPQQEGDPYALDASAYVLQGEVKMGEEEKSVKIFSMQNPVRVLKNRFYHEKGTFKRIDGKILHLTPTVDVMIVDEVIYLFTMAGENLFHMEHAYKATCRKSVEEVIATGIVSDTEAFSQMAVKGHNPRRFVSFNQKRLEYLKKREQLEKMAEYFELDLTTDGKIDTSSEKGTERLVKILCDKGMGDPFENKPVEVSSAVKW